MSVKKGKFSPTGTKFVKRRMENEEEFEGLPSDKRPAKKDRIKLPKNYFRHVNPIITAIIVIGLFVFITLMAYFPHLLPHMHLGAFGLFLHKISTTYPIPVEVFYLFCMAVHTIEGLLGFYLSRFRYKLNWFATFKWTISSFIHGYFSLRFLFNP